jgi:hypothetical protein
MAMKPSVERLSTFGIEDRRAGLAQARGEIDDPPLGGPTLRQLGGWPIVLGSKAALLKGPIALAGEH